MTNKERYRWDTYLNRWKRVPKGLIEELILSGWLDLKVFHANDRPAGIGDDHVKHRR